jgi:hypothetical protein
VDPPLVNWITSKPDVVAVEYHTWWPYAGDPFYLANPAEQADRVYFYGIGVVPSIRFDGPHPPSANNPTAYEARYQERKALGSRAQLEIDATYSGGSLVGGGTATVRAIAESALSGDWRVRLAITENDIDYAAPNGINVHHHVFRKFVPDTLGTAVAFAAPYPDTITLVLPFTIAGAWAAENIALVAFLQEEASREIEQGAEFLFQDEIVSVGSDGAGAGSVLALGAARPNPFASATRVALSLGRAARVSASVHDASGRRIRTLVDDFVAAGERALSWDGRDESGRDAAPGVYFLRVETGGAAHTRRLTLLR